MTNSVKIRTMLMQQRVPAALCVLVLLALMVIEFCHPYFFLQCDNRDFFLPCYVHNTRALLGGEFPLFNFHQHLGTPVTIQYSAFYLPNYIAVLLSDVLLGHPFGTMELLAAFHLPLAAVGFYRFMRYFDLDEAACCFGGLSWALCAFVITGANSWMHIAAMAAWMPWILLFSLRQTMGSGRRDFLILVALRSSALFVGYPQTFACLVLFDCAMIFPLYLRARNTHSSPAHLMPTPAKLLSRIAANYACVILVTMPLLVQAAQQVAASFERQTVYSWQDYVSFSYNVKYWLHGLLMPFTKLDYRFWPEQDFISHLGYLPLFCIITAVVLKKYHGRTFPVALFTVLAVVSFFWSIDLIITRIMYHVPVFNRFKMPFKQQFFTSFFLIALASFGFNAFQGWWRSRHSGSQWLAIGAILLHFCGMVTLYAAFPQRVYSKHDDPVPFDEPLKRELTGGRIVSVGLDVVHDGQHTLWGNSAPSLGFNYATLWGLQHFGGYDSLLPEKNFLATFKSNYRSDFNVAPGDTLDVKALVPLEHFRVWGVRWYVIDRNIPLVNVGPLQQVFEDRFRRVYTDPGSRPMAGWIDGSRKGVSYSFRTNTMLIDTDRNDAGTLLLNVLHSPGFSVFIDGTPVPFEETDDGQVSMAVPAGRHAVRLAYSNRTFVFSAAVSVSCILLVFIFLLYEKNVKHRGRGNRLV